MRNALALPSKRKLISAAFSVITLLAGNAAAEQVTANNSDMALQEPRPFEAQYRLEISGWPGATITHTLSNEGLHWLSDMSFSVAIARGQERSRFSIDERSTHSLLYNSSYSLLGIGDSYQLNEGDIRSLDRQAALFDLSRRADYETCTQVAPCDVEFVDHRGRDEHFHYFVSEPGRVSVPAGEFEAKRVTLINADKPDRFLKINFHPDWPGLILSAEYQKEGRRETTITMTQFNPAGGNAP